MPEANITMMKGMENAERREPGLLVGRDGHVAIVVLDRPERANSFNAAMLDRLQALWLELDADPQVRCIVMGTAVKRFFCTGRDLKEAVDIGVGGDRSMSREPLFTSRLAGVWKPLICAVEGMAVGGGLNFVLDADIAIAGKSATFLDPHVDIGQVAGRSSLALARKVGLGNALYLTLAGGGIRWDAQRAMQHGLLQEVVEDGNALARAIELGHLVARNSPSAVSKTMEALWSYADSGNFEQALRHTWVLLRRQRDHPDSKEGPLAFGEKRDPVWHVR